MPGQPGDSSYEWVDELDEDQIRIHWWTGLIAMAALHRVDWRSLDLSFPNGDGKWTDPVEPQLDGRGHRLSPLRGL